MSLLTSCVVMKFGFVPRGLSFFFVLVSCRHFQEQIMNVLKMPCPQAADDEDIER